VLPLDHFQGDAEVVEHRHGKIVKQNSCPLPVPVLTSRWLVLVEGWLVRFLSFKKARRIATTAGCKLQFSAGASSSVSSAGLVCFSGRGASVESLQEVALFSGCICLAGPLSAGGAGGKTILPFYIRHEPVGKQVQVRAVLLAYFP
jgi:hypothetical protein